MLVRLTLTMFCYHVCALLIRCNIIFVTLVRLIRLIYLEYLRLAVLRLSPRDDKNLKFARKELRVGAPIYERSFEFHL